MIRYLVTGAAGFIGSHFVKYLLKQETNIFIVILDKMTYAGNLENLKEALEEKERVHFIQGDICDTVLVEKIFSEYDIDCIVNFAAESHVDKSIESPKIFLETNIIGVQNLMDFAKRSWSIGKDEKGYPVYKRGKKFLQISTDEVYGNLTKDFPEGKFFVFEEENLDVLFQDREKTIVYGSQFFTETSPLRPSSPYSSSKAAADMLVSAYFETYHFPINITRCSNNYGPCQFPEKLIPLMIKNVLEGKKLPIYGDGMQVRDWLYVEDHCKAIYLVLKYAKCGEIYNIGAFQEKTNVEIVSLILDMIAKFQNTERKSDLIEYVEDRLGHDRRYAIYPKKIVQELGWVPETNFEIGMQRTIQYFMKKILTAKR